MHVLDFISGVFIGFCLGVILVLLFKVSIQKDDELEAEVNNID